MKRKFKLFFIVCLLVTISNVCFARQMVNDATGVRCIDDNGLEAVTAYRWFDLDNDGNSNMYYFDENGYLLHDEDNGDGYVYLEDGKIKFDEILMELPNADVPEKHLSMMTNKNDLNECELVYGTFYNSTEAILKKYVTNFETLMKRYSEGGYHSLKEDLKNEGFSYVTAFTRIYYLYEIKRYYQSQELSSKWDDKFRDLSKKYMKAVNDICWKYRNYLDE